MLLPADLDWLVAARRHLHRRPELALEEGETAAFIAECLDHLGLPYEAHVGGHGIVATVEGRGEGASVGLRADMDALPIVERTGLDYASDHAGRMHACGHDGHMAILLGAGIALSREREFAGRVHLIFQPAEERYGGARMMLADGMLDRYPMERVFGLHNWPGLAAGQVVVHDGPVMAGTSEFAVRFRAEGGHVSQPHLTGDPLLSGGYFLTTIQQAVARSIDPLESAVVAVGSFNGGVAQNVIPQLAELTGTIRSFRQDVLLHLQERVRIVAASAGASAGCGVEVTFDEPLCPPVVNTPLERDLMREAARDAGLDLGSPIAPTMGGDDFGDLLLALPGAYAFLGNGPHRPEAGLHQPKYDFNDDIIAPGATLLAQTALLALRQAADRSA